MTLFLPKDVGESIVADRLDDRAREARAFTARLREVDQRLIAFFAERDHPMFEINKGYWYVFRLGEEGAAFFKVERDGKPCEPDERWIKEFQDLQNPRVWRDVQKRQQQRFDEMDRDRERKAEERRAQLQEQLDYRFRTQVPVRPDGRGRLTS